MVATDRISDLTTITDLDTLNEELGRDYLRGLWAREMASFNAPRPFGVPHVWKWDRIRAGLEVAKELVPLDNTGLRRTLALVNPSLFAHSGGTTHTMNMSVQLVKPGEIATAHRHTASAVRFILEGEIGAYTIVNGEKCTMERGDLILTPNFTWHEHRNETDRNIIWIDGLDASLVQTLRAGFSQPRPEGNQQLTSEEDHTVRRPGSMAPPGATPHQIVFKWRNTLAALCALTAEERSPYDGRVLEYRNPAAGKHALLTFGCWIQMLDPGEETAWHRHTYSHIYHAFQGGGVTDVEDQELLWEESDCAVVPNWMWHRHRNPNAQAAILFSMNDLPVLEALGLAREEAR